MTRQLKIRCERDTAILAELLAPSCREGLSLGLCGDLGAGKTTFVRYLVKALGCSAESVSSPSFTLENEYRLPSGQVVEHWDLYRLKTLPIELLEPPAKGVLRIVEWPDRIEGFVDSLELVVSLRVTSGEAREIVLSGIKAAGLTELTRDLNSKECSQSA